MTKLLNPTLKRERLSDKVWMKPERELSRYFKTVTLLMCVSEWSEDVRIFHKRVKTLIKRSGINFTFLYLKECARLIVRFLAGSGECEFHSKGIYVSRDPQGLPRILTPKLRSALIKERVSPTRKGEFVQFVLTVVNVFRVFRSVQKVKLSTITRSFEGTSRTLDVKWISSAVTEILGSNSFQPKSTRFLKLETSSPYSFKATWGCSSDLIALWHNPYNLSKLIKLSRKSDLQSILILVWFLVMLILACPVSIISYFLYGRMRLGRLGVVYDQAGKARVVGITNYFLQIFLKPYHDAVFKILETIPQDGTFNQYRPLEALFYYKPWEKPNTDVYHSFDLSAATDRLPIEIQVDVLNQLETGLGNTWRSLLDFEWISPNQKHLVRYSVGQPMGAYLSWAMLAFTHHVIIRYSAHRVGIENFKHYCVLGDDVVIQNPLVAKEYLELMKHLGVSINLSKSVISDKFVEFAKVLRGPGIEFTPLGPGVILRFLRDGNYIGAVLAELLKTRYYKHYSACLKFLDSLIDDKKLKSFRSLGLWSIFGLKGAMWKLMPGDVTPFRWAIVRALISASLRVEPVVQQAVLTGGMIEGYDEVIRLDLYRSLKAFYLQRIKENFGKIYNSFVSLLIMSTYSTTRYWLLGYFEILSRWFTPGIWVYLVDLLRDLIDSIDTYFKIQYSSLVNYMSWDGMDDLIKDDLDISTLDWTNKRKIKTYSMFHRKMINGLKFWSNPLNLKIKIVEMEQTTVWTGNGFWWDLIPHESPSVKPIWYKVTALPDLGVNPSSFALKSKKCSVGSRQGSITKKRDRKSVV